MKICLIVDDYMPYSIKVAAKMMHELACEYINQGYEVTVVTPDPKLKTKYEIKYLDDVQIVYFKSGEIKNVNKIKRAINETMLSYNAWNNSNEFFRNNPHDLIVYYSPSIFFGSLVNKLKKLWNIKSYLILRDLFPQWAIDNGMLKETSIITKYFKYFEKVNYKAADTIGLMSNKNLEWFQDYYKTDKKCEVLYNWTNTNDNVSAASNKYKKQLDLEDKIVFFYGGNMGHAQDMLNLVRLAKRMQKYDEVHFVFVGAGDEVELIKETIKKDNILNITLLPSVNQEEFKIMLTEFDVGLFTLNKYHKTHNFPGKLLGYLTEGLPILGSINLGNDLKDIVDEYQAGLISVNGEDDALYDNAVKLLDSVYRDKMISNAKCLLNDKFTVESAVKQIKDN
jgi:hypothetical protein